jgi:hypothetical protein
MKRNKVLVLICVDGSCSGFVGSTVSKMVYRNSSVG